MRRLKYELDRKSLEIIYTTSIRPFFEYADVFGITAAIMKNRPSKKIEAARIASGATKLLSIQNLYKEIGWETLEKQKN